MHELVLNSNEKTFLAVDVGSNAMRAAMACLDNNNDLELLSTLRFPLRLGEDVFQTKKISKKKILKTLDAFSEIKDLNDKYKFKKIRVVATSALRDAENSQELISKVKDLTGLEIEVIDGQTEAELIFQAVASQIKISKSRSILIDVGGGSTEITLCEGHKILFSKSYDCGTVRLLESGQYKEQQKTIKEFATKAFEEISPLIGKNPIDFCIGTGGNLRRMGKLRKIFFKRSSLKVTQIELSSILNEIKSFSIEQRVDYLDMRQDRADVIIPATKIIEELMLQFSFDEILLPKVGLKEGMIINLLEKKPRTILFN